MDDLLDPRPAAVSPLTAPLLAGDPSPALVLAVFPTCLYLGLAGHADVLPVETSDGLGLPTALRLGRTSTEIRWGIDPGGIAIVGRGEVRVGCGEPDCDGCDNGIRIRGARAWRPSRVRARRPDPQVRVSALAHGPVDEVGLGAGLTPSGDDRLVGWLLVAAAVGATPQLARATREALGRTTSLSASLIAAAIDGYAVDPIVRLVDAALSGEAAVVRSCLPRVLSVGHSSGGDVVQGVVAALRTMNQPVPQELRDFDSIESTVLEGSR